jgi:cellulose synthase/poly-beta-1,6-N-acetylglucosamine synthase-like glycosyltransferase
LIQIVTGYNLVFPLILFLLFRLKFKDKKRTKNIEIELDYAIIVTAYEQTSTLPAVVNSILKLNYTNYLVYIIADNCDVTELKFSDERIIVLRPENTLASNTRSHFHAIKNFKRRHELLTIIDSDNLVHPNYLNELNRYFAEGYQAVQGIREAKNLNTTFACLDAARDIYYHFYDGRVLFELGSSATLAGSGMAFTTELYRDCLEKLDVTGAGFDKVLQFEIVKRSKRIAFATGAKVYDEKTAQKDQLVNQRARWINTWFKYFKFGFTLVYSGIQKLNLNQFLFGIVLLRPPLFIFLILSAMFSFLNLFLNPIIAGLWIGGLLTFVVGFFIPVLDSRTDKRIIQSLIDIPKFMFFQVVSLLKVRGANKRSVATKHFNEVKIDEIIQL